MSDLLGGAGQSEIWIERDDKRLLSAYWQFPFLISELTPIPDAPVGSHRSQFWPGGGGLNGDAGDVNPLYGVWYTNPDLTRGSTQRFGIVGVTRDVYGSPLGGVTCKFYRTSTDEMVFTVVSDPLGNFLVTTPYYPDAHYLVFYKAGSPDIFATTQNTLIAG